MGYRNQGYDFTITSSTAFDHKWIPERNIYDSISIIVDELFADYLARPNVRQPILTQYCDGRQVQCPNWMTILLQRIKKFLPIIYMSDYTLSYILLATIICSNPTTRCTNPNIIANSFYSLACHSCTFLECAVAISMFPGIDCQLLT